MSDDRPLDLSPLDIAPQRRAALLAAIRTRGEPILARYAARGPVAVLADWLRPMLAAAAIVAAVAVGALLADRGENAGATPTVAEALGFPGPMVAWAEAGWEPSLEELVVTLEEDTR